MKTHTEAQCETHSATAVVLESGKVFKIRYLSDAHGTSNSHGVIPLADKTKTLSQKDALDGTEVSEGNMITVVFGTKIDSRLGKLEQSLLGFRSDK